MTDAMTMRVFIRVKVDVVVGQQWSTHLQFHLNHQFHDGTG
jgi:hypothetical protein